MRPPLVSVSIETCAQFYDLDPMGIVWHGHYPRFMEMARMALLRRIDYGYEAMTESGYGWPIVDMGIRYAKPIKLQQPIKVTAGFVEWENRLKTVFEIFDAVTGSRLTRGHSIQVAVDLKTGELLWETPPILREKLAPFLEQQGLG